MDIISFTAKNILSFGKIFFNSLLVLKLDKVTLEFLYINLK